MALEQVLNEAAEEALDEAVELDAKAPQKPNPIRQLARAVRATHTLGHANGRPFVVPIAGGDAPGAVPGVAYWGAELRRMLTKIGREISGCPPVSRTMGDTVLLQLEADAFDHPETDLALRFHDAGDRIVLDLGCPDGHAVTITANGWDTGPAPRDVTFRRSHAIRPLPVPTRGGTLGELAPLLALDPHGETFRGLLGWTTGLAFCSSSRPGLVLTGAPGNGKSTRQRLAISIVEPTAATDFSKHFGRNIDDDEVRALHRAVPAWDNVSSLSWLASDALCVMITGGSREGRKLYTDDSMSSAAIMRPVAMTAVATPAGLKPDALDRLVVLDVQTPAARLADAEVQHRFDTLHPGLLGAWCDAVAAVLRWRPCTAMPDGNPRMAGYAHHLAALDAAVAAGDLKGCPGDLLGAWSNAHTRVQQQTAADDTFGGALIAMLEKIPLTYTPDDPVPAHRWEGKAGDLLGDYRLMTAAGNRAQPGWPASPRGVPVVLSQLKEPLAACRVTWTVTTPNHGRGNTYLITLRD